MKARDATINLFSKLGLSNTVLLTNPSMLDQSNYKYIQLLASLSKPSYVANIFKKEGFSEDKKFLQQNNTMYGLIKPILYKSPDLNFIIYFRLGYPSDVGNFIVPLTRDVEDSFFLEAHKAECNIFYASELHELLHITSQFVFSGTYTNESDIARIESLISIVDRNTFESSAKEIFFKSAKDITDYLYSKKPDYKMFKQIFFKSKGY